MGSHERSSGWNQQKHDWIESAFRRLFESGELSHPPFPRSPTARVLRDIHHAHNAIAGSNSEFLKPYNLTEAKFRLLMWLVIADRIGYPDGMRPSELSEFQGISRNTVSAMLKTLEAQGLIRRQDHPADRRQQIITISDDGRKLLSRAGEDYLAFVEASLDTLTEDEREQLSVLLEKLSRSIVVQRLAGHHPPVEPAIDPMAAKLEQPISDEPA